MPTAMAAISTTSFSRILVDDPDLRDGLTGDRLDEAIRDCVAGTYGYTSNGSIVTPPIGPFVAVGTVTFAKSGTLSGAQVTSIAGNFFDETIQGPFTVNPDCTGSATVSVYHGTTLARVTNLQIVWDDDRQEARGLFLTQGTAVSIVARKMNSDD